MHLLIFDLDGTLIDSKADLAHAVNAMLAQMGRPELPHETISSYVGNGAPLLVRRALGPNTADSEVERALDFFIRYYSEHCLDNTGLYPGVREALDRFRSSGSKLAVLTNKPVRISGRILTGLGLDQHFFRVYGGNSFDQKKPDPVGIRRLLDETSVPAERTIMVGDSAVDVLTARNAGVQACGVTYGFQPETFVATPPDFLVGDLGELADRLLG